MDKQKRGRGKRGSGSVYWSKSQDRWYGEVTLGFDDEGIRIRKVIVGERANASEDEKKAVAQRLQLLVGKLPAPTHGERRRAIKRITFGEYLAQWLAERDPNARVKSNLRTERERLSVAAFAAYTWAADTYIVPKLGDKQLHAIGRGTLRTFLNGLDLGDASKEKVRTVLQAACRDAARQVGDEPPVRADNPALDLDFERSIGRATNKETAAWSKEDALKFLRAAKGTPFFDMYLLMLVGGLGPAECFGIRWRNVDLDRGRVRITGNLTEVAGKLVEKETKEASRVRNVVLPGVVAKALRARYKRENPSSTDYVFTSPNGGPIYRTLFRKRVWLPLLKKAKVPGITLYGLRHSAASIMGALGVPMLVASKALGHANTRTISRYAHYFDETASEVADKFGEFLKGI